MIRTNILPTCSHEPDSEDFKLCSVITNMAVAGQNYLLHHLDYEMKLELLLFIAKIIKSELKARKNFDDFVRLGRTVPNRQRRDTLVCGLTHIITNPFFKWGVEHGILNKDPIIWCCMELTTRREIRGENIREVLENCKTFLRWTTKLRLCGLGRD